MTFHWQMEPIVAWQETHNLARVQWIKKPMSVSRDDTVEQIGKN